MESFVECYLFRGLGGFWSTMVDNLSLIERTQYTRENINQYILHVAIWGRNVCVQT